MEEDLTEINFLREHNLILIIIIIATMVVPKIINLVVAKKLNRIHAQDKQRQRRNHYTSVQKVKLPKLNATFKDVINALDSVNSDCKLLLRRARLDENKFENEWKVSENFLLEMKQEIEKSLSMQDDYLLLRRRELQRLMDDLERNKLYNNDFVRQQMHRHKVFMTKLLSDECDGASSSEISLGLENVSLSRDTYHERMTPDSLDGSSNSGFNSSRECSKHRKEREFVCTFPNQRDTVRRVSSDQAVTPKRTCHWQGVTRRYISPSDDSRSMKGQGDIPSLGVKQISLPPGLDATFQHRIHHKDVPSILKQSVRSEGSYKMTNDSTTLPRRSNSEKAVRFSRNISISERPIGLPCKKFLSYD